MRSPFVYLVCVVLIGCAASPPTRVEHFSQASMKSSDAPRRVGCIGITVSDADRLSRFYREVLTFERASESRGEDAELGGTHTIRMSLGSECVDLTEYANKGRAVPEGGHSNDVAFQHVAIVVRDMDAAYAVLQKSAVEGASVSPQRLPDWNKNAAGIRAYYFKDPDRHTLEIISFPRGKGDPRWQEPSARLFLGIDHTAIVVTDTDRSVAFYEASIGLHVAGGSENYGVEQERLNNVAGAHLRITTLRGASGPGVELLEYLAPLGGRLFPADQRPNDVAHWQTPITADETAGARLLRDPDGHAVLLRQ